MATMFVEQIKPYHMQQHDKACKHAGADKRRPRMSSVKEQREERVQRQEAPLQHQLGAPVRGHARALRGRQPTAGRLRAGAHQQAQHLRMGPKVFIRGVILSLTHTFT